MTTTAVSTDVRPQSASEAFAALTNRVREIEDALLGAMPHLASSLGRDPLPHNVIVDEGQPGPTLSTDSQVAALTAQNAVLSEKIDRILANLDRNAGLPPASQPPDPGQASPPGSPSPGPAGPPDNAMGSPDGWRG